MHRIPYLADTAAGTDIIHGHFTIYGSTANLVENHKYLKVKIYVILLILYDFL